MGKNCFVRVGFIILISLLISPPAVWAQENLTQQEDRVADSIAADKGRALTSAEELIEMLKQRALRKIEAERKKQLWTTKGTMGLHIGHDNNVNTDAERRGDFYNEQYFSYSWVPTFSDYFSADIGTWYFSDWYFDTRDTTIVDNAFKAALKWHPRGAPELEVEPGIERSYLYYPHATQSTYVEDKAWFKFTHKFWKRWSQDAKYEFSFKEYDTRQPRDGIASIAYKPGMALEKFKQSVEYNFGFPIGVNTVKLKHKAYKETSNDAYQDYYHLYSYKIAVELSRSLTKKLFAKLTCDYERKNYYERVVPDYQVAEYDDIYSQKLALYYPLKKGWTLSYTFTNKKSDSNYAIYDYDTLTHIAGVYISF